MKIFDAQATRDALPFDRLIQQLRERFIAGCEVPPRQVLELPAANGPGEGSKLTSLIMPAWTTGQYYGVKIVNIAPGNSALGLPGLHSQYLLFDARTGAPLAQLDGDEITARRTAAASALAASYLARKDSQHLLVVGAGKVARLLPQAYEAAVPSVARVSIWSRRHEAASAMARDWSEQAGINALATADLEKACGEADIVSCATMASSPLVRGHWLAAGSHLDLIGGFTPAMREADDACFEHARVFVDTEEALQKSGDLLSPMSRDIFSADDVRGTLTTLCKGVAVGRRSVQDRTVFKSVGTALEDLAAATLVYESAT
ncbi:ornithine cyclodeaminase family protein [Hydrogenophaga sp. 5NK40-0174]|uniref:ornithine cyclodeaminase family protein n=1 Tax=Hydrogenophaga sp. 5NK40-0174 TaxID=3127649 RepID=UPI003108FA52